MVWKIRRKEWGEMEIGRLGGSQFIEFRSERKWEDREELELWGRRWLYKKR